MASKTASSSKAKDSTARRLYPNQVRTCLIHAMKCRVPVFVWGPPGIGKSDLIASIAKSQGRQLIDLRMLLLDPTDVKGIPYYNTDTNTMEWAKPGELPEVVNETSLQRLIDELAVARKLEGDGSNVDHNAKVKNISRLEAMIKRTERALKFQNAILFLDELNAAVPSVQAAAYQLVLNRRVGEYELPAGVDIIAAGNRETDKGTSYRMPTPLANRFTHIEMQANVDDWVDWAINDGVHPEVIGFIKQHQHKLFTFDPAAPDKAFGTPRSWHKTSTLLLEDGLDEDLVSAMVAGTVGEGTAIEFMQHRRFASKLPSPHDVINGIATKLNVEEISAMYTLSISACYVLKERKETLDSGRDPKYTKKDFYKQVDFFFRFIMDNFNTEVTVLAAKTLMRDFGVQLAVSEMSTFTEFYEKYGKYIIAKRK